MSAAGSRPRRRRWLLEVLCVIFGVIGAVSDVVGGFAPARLVSPLALVSFLGFMLTVFLKIRHTKSVVEIVRLLVPTLLAVIFGTYVVLFPLVYLCQDAIANRTSAFFQPWPLSAEAVQSHLSPRVDVLEITTADNLRLQGWLVKSSREPRAPLVIYFGGSGSSSTDIIVPAQQLEGWSVAILSYRGFGLSEGSPTQADVLADATLIYDTLSRRPDIDPDRIVAMGYSLGTAVAVHLSAERPVAATILVAPFDSLTLTGVRRPLLSLPLRPIMKHYFDSSARAPTIHAPLLCLIGLRDKDVPPELALKLLSLWGGDTEVEVYVREDHDLLLHDNSSWSDIASFLRGIASRGP